MSTIRLSELYHLRHEGLLAGDRFGEEVWQDRDREYWITWAQRALLALGAGHLLAGIIFFFAYNWTDMPPMAKFATLDAGIVATAVGALVVGIRKLAGQALLVAASVLVGGLLAVIGQVYQTGADAYELFVYWSLLILPWTLASRSVVQWTCWLTVVYAASAFYCIQVLIPLGEVSGTQAILLLGALVCIGLATREVAEKLGLSWVAVAWTRYFLLFAAMAHFFVTASAVVLDFNQEALPVPLMLLAVGGGVVLYRWVIPEFAAFALLVAYGGIFLMVVGGRGISETVGFSGSGPLLLSLALLVAWCVLITGSMGKLLLALKASHHGGTYHHDMRQALPGSRTAEGADRPWYIQGIVGFGAWISGLVMIAFGVALVVVVMEISNPGPVIGVLGFVFFGIGIGLQLGAHDSLFRAQFSISLSAAGIALAAGGIGFEFEAVWVAAVISVLLAAFVAWSLLSLTLQTLASILAAVLAVASLAEQEVPYFLGLISLSLVAGCVLISHPPQRDLRPTACILLFIGPLVMILYDSGLWQEIWPDLNAGVWFARAIQIGLFLWLARGLWLRMAGKYPRYELVAFAATAAALGLMMPPGGSAALVILVLAFALGSRLLALPGILLQMYFIVHFYYQLEASLIAKSLVLSAAGAVLLVLWGVVHRTNSVEADR